MNQLGLLKGLNETGRWGCEICEWTEFLFKAFLQKTLELRG